MAERYNKNEKQHRSFRDSIREWVVFDFLRVPAALYEATSAKANVILKGLVKKVGMALSNSSSGGRADFEAPEFDMNSIENAYNADGYVREAVDKYIDLLFKAGYDIVGKNVKAVEYIKIRLAYIAEVTGIPTDILFNEIATDIVKFQNAIIAKSRADDPNALPPGSSIQGLDGNNPIGGYFVQPVQTFQVKRDKFGVVKGWQQQVEGQNKASKFKPEDIVHIYMKRSPGKAFAYPRLLAVIDDVRSLREIEERVLHMVFRNVHPLIHAKVGSTDIPGQPQEVQDVKADMENMSVEGGTVTTERVSIDTINTKNTIDVEPYLLYFEKRVFTGLGVSETMMGRGDSANRNTGDNQKEEAVDRVKSIQKVLSVFITSCMITELLREGGFDPLNKPEDKVEFVFKDPDQDNKIKQEAHAIFLYQSNAITETEMRIMLSRDPVPDADRETLWFNQYGNKNTNDQASNTIMPANQSGKKTSPKKQTNTFDMQMNEYMLDLRRGLIQYVKDLYNLHTAGIKDVYIQQIIANTDRHVQYIETLTTKLIEEQYGQDQLNSISNNIHHIFKQVYDVTIDTMATHNTEEVAKETIYALFDVFVGEFKDLINQLIGGDHKRG